MKLLVLAIPWVVVLVVGGAIATLILGDWKSRGFGRRKDGA